MPPLRSIQPLPEHGGDGNPSLCPLSLAAPGVEMDPACFTIDADARPLNHRENRGTLGGTDGELGET